MAVVTTVSVGLKRNFNLGNYNSYEVQAWVSAQVEPEESPDQAARQLFELCRGHIKEQAEPIVRPALTARSVRKYEGKALNEDIEAQEAEQAKAMLDQLGME